MKIGFYNQALNSGHSKRGIGFYAKNLLENLKQKSDIEVIEFSKLDKLKPVDLIHYTHFDLFNFTLPLSKKYPTVVTIHDVTPLVFPASYPPGIKGMINHKLQKLSLKTVSAVITDSTNSKTDIQKYLGVDPQKIKVIYLAASSEYKVIKDKEKLQKIEKKYNLPKQFAIYTGSVNWNKNLVNMTKACLNLDLDIVLVGKDFFTKDNLGHHELKSFAEFEKLFSSNPKVHKLGFVETEELVGILNLAEVLLLPSFYEGFGLTILEAQACGVAVITSKISSMPEVAGGAAEYVDPYLVEDIERGIKKILEDKEYKKKLVNLGFENIKRFSWDKTTQETINVYENVLDR